MKDIPLQQHETALMTNGFYTLIETSGLIRVSGTMARAFCHRMFSNDIEKLNKSHATAAAWCLPNGRVQALFRIYLYDNALFLSVSRDLVPTLIKRLRMYILRDDVTVEDVSEKFLSIGIGGEMAYNVLRGFFSMLPDKPYIQSYTYGANLIRVSDAFGFSRYLLFVPAEQENLWKMHLQSLNCVGDQGWLLSEIDSGTPVINSSNEQMYIPQMLCLEENNALSYTKGCYPGQEIVARSRFRGAVKRHLAHFMINVPVELAPGTDIVSDKNQLQGQVLCSVINGKNTELLAVVMIGSSNERVFISQDEQTLELSAIDLPYSYANSIEKH